MRFAENRTAHIGDFVTVLAPPKNSFNHNGILDIDWECAIGKKFQILHIRLNDNKKHDSVILASSPYSRGVANSFVPKSFANGFSWWWPSICLLPNKDWAELF